MVTYVPPNYFDPVDIDVADVTILSIILNSGDFGSFSCFKSPLLQLLFFKVKSAKGLKRPSNLG